ncbi:intradiol ring-cleavage dioxygenase [Cupriavidus lacunae]|uniref:Hydroxyquinol 1,2-dioxygenase n=1 Tax=Cupriavidus lacunae TaxID=2666307 RepID=A0A370NIB4_9BURK|nr:intradiol ring-cleavage dioxygenase [Cupriavidus lacunae]RDK05329.1 hydroxyquinol 1,2-dioxygenase [Cupriavidus lacunae]
MINLNEDTITGAVIQRNAQAKDARLRELMVNLVQHLHAFARETQLTEEEWQQGIQFLTRVGQMCDENRQEFILLSDTLGLSTLVMALNHRKPAGCTEATVFGPFYVHGAPELPLGADIANGAKGAPCYVSGTVRGDDGRIVANAEIQVWQADEDGFYDVQYTGKDQLAARAVLRSDADGNYHFRSILAEPYPIPHDGPVGDMLEALNRHPWRPAHLHFLIRAEGHQSLTTHVFRKGDKYLESDAVFGVRSTLVADWVRHEAGTAPDGSRTDQPFYVLHFDFVLARAGA